MNRGYFDFLAVVRCAGNRLIEQSGHELTVTLPLRPVYVTGDPVRLAQAFMNLLANAVKYTERGGRIWLTVEREESECSCG